MPNAISLVIILQVKRAVRRGIIIQGNRRRILKRAFRFDGSDEDNVGVAINDTRMKTTWRIDGWAGESSAAKARRREMRGLDQNPEKTSLLRGLHVSQDDNKMKFFDRDVGGADNIGMLWISDRVIGRSRPERFDPAFRLENHPRDRTPREA
jgi:hypothetical protein